MIKAAPVAEEEIVEVGAEVEEGEEGAEDKAAEAADNASGGESESG